MVRPPYLMTQGIISACAGSTSRRNCATCGSGDHPRMRGEHVSLPTDIVPLMGSSPHARGARGRRCRRMRPCRIIPACAGSTPSPSSSGSSWRDHPRMRGEHYVEHGLGVVPMGSSPHARGALQLHAPVPVEPGIIPACAGSTCLYAYTTSSHPDHPRMRGEHFHLSLPRPLFRGSSPHARGARAVAVERTTAAGIIPACAGSTLKDLEVACGWGDHPRMRGEHELPMQLAKSNGGSSPHARGALLADIPPRVRAGIIPACAGSTPRYWRRPRRARDHPRMRGEHFLLRLLRRLWGGSSPHARGARQAPS